jgi:ABC-2 type transport system permease protein
MVTTATNDRFIVIGEVLGRFAVAMLQAIVILVAGRVLFGIHWGNPLAVAAVIIGFALFSTSASVLLGCLFRASEEVAPMRTAGIYAGLGVLGGCFFSLALVPTWLRVIGHGSPHAWAVDGLGRLGATNVGLRGVAVSLIVLFGLGFALFGFAVRRLRGELRA